MTLRWPWTRASEPTAQSGENGGWVFRPACARCGRPCSLIELVPPRAMPRDEVSWDPGLLESFRERRYPDAWYMLYEGPEAGNGLGSPITEQKVERLIEAFSLEPDAGRIRVTDFFDDAGFCLECALFYCPRHWHISSTGWGTCPRGHGKGLDPHWSPDD